MSLMRHVAKHSVIASFLEVVIFFTLLILIAGILPLMVNAWVKAARGTLAGAFWDLGVWMSAAPVWLWLVISLLLLAGVTLYWTPSEPRQDNAELLAAVIFIALCIVAGVVWLQIRYRTVSIVVESFRRNLAA